MSNKVKQETEVPDLNAKQVEALALLLAGKTGRDAAAELGINEATISRWLNKDANFIAAYNSGLESLWDAGFAELLDLRRRAMGTLSDLLDCDDLSLRLKAAVAIMRQEVKRPKGPTDPSDIIFTQSLQDIFKGGP